MTMTSEQMQVILENKTLKALVKQQEELITDMRDVLRFCAMSSVGTHYQQQSAREMLINSKKIVWSRHNEDGTYGEEYKQWVLKHHGQESLDQMLAEEKELA